MGGAERYLASLSIGLARRGHEVAVAVFYGGGAFEREIAMAGVEVVDLAKRGRWDVLGFGARWVRLLRTRRPDIVYGVLTIPSLVALLARPVAHAAPVWGVQTTGYTAVATDWLDRVTGRAEVGLARRSSVVIANSAAGRDDLVGRGVPASLVHVVPNGVDIDRFRRDPVAGARLRAEWGFTADERVVGIVGRVDPVKDHSTFLLAAAQVSRARDNVRFAVVGGGRADYLDQLRREAESLGIAPRVHFAGSRDDIPAVMSALDVVVSSSTSEGMSNVVVEAMACGTAVVVTDVGDSASVVGATGRVVPVADPDALGAAALAELGRLDADEEGVRESVRARIESAYTLDLLVTRTEQLLSAVLR